VQDTLRARGAERAFERADHRFTRIAAQIAVAALAVRSKLEHLSSSLVATMVLARAFLVAASS
jgi:hypothetical protein